MLLIDKRAHSHIYNELHINLVINFETEFSEDEGKAKWEAISFSASNTKGKRIRDSTKLIECPSIVNENSIIRFSRHEHNFVSILNVFPSNIILSIKLCKEKKNGIINGRNC